MHTFVSCFIDLNYYENRPENKNTDFYIEKGNQLLSMPFQFIVFTDKHSLSKLKKSENIYYILIELYDLPIYQIFDKDKSVLPFYSNPSKDTFNYLALIISKTFFVNKAIELDPFHSSHFSWIDFGILHVINIENNDIFINSLQKISEYKENKIRIPGCYKPEQIVFDYPYWSFCGGLFSGDKKSLQIFHQKMLDYLIKLDKITWEINIWAFIYIQYPELFDWYYGDHNILMFSNF